MVDRICAMSRSASSVAVRRGPALRCAAWRRPAAAGGMRPEGRRSCSPGPASSAAAASAVGAAGAAPLAPLRACRRADELPGSPAHRLPRRRLLVEGCAVASLRARYGTPLYVYSRAPMLDALAGYQRALAGRDHLICYAMKANSNLAVLQTFARAGCGFDIVSGGELERVLAAGGDAGAGRVFRRRQDARRDARGARRRRALLQRRERSRARAAVARSRRGPARRARVSLRVNPDVDARTHPYISTGLKTTSSASPPATPSRPIARAAALPGLESSASTATSARRSPTRALPRRARPPARPRRGGRGRRHRDRAHRPRRRPRHRYADEDAAGRRDADARACSNASTRAATAIASSCSSPAARSSATPACW